MTIVYVLLAAIVAHIVSVKFFDVNLADKAINRTTAGIERKTKSNLKQEYVTPYRDTKLNRYKAFVQNISDSVTRTGLFGIKTAISFEMFVAVCLLLSTLVMLVFFIISKLAIVSLALFASTYITLNSIAYAVIRYSLFTREVDVIDAIDFICPSIMDGKGVIESIKEQLPNLPPGVREEFNTVVNEINFEARKPDQVFAKLKRYLGPTSYLFADRCVAFILNETHGASKVFETIIARNDSIKAYNTIIVRRLSEKLTEMYAIMAMVLGMLVYVMLRNDTSLIIKEWYGQLIISAVILALSVANAKIQLEYKTAGGENE